MNQPKRTGEARSGTQLGLRLSTNETTRLDALVRRVGGFATRHKIAKLALLKGLEWYEKNGPGTLGRTGKSGG